MNRVPHQCSPLHMHLSHRIKRHTGLPTKVNKRDVVNNGNCKKTVSCMHIKMENYTVLQRHGQNDDSHKTFLYLREPITITNRF